MNALHLTLRLAMSLPLCAMLEGGDGELGAQLPRVLYAVEAPAVLAGGYGLGVATVPPPPAFLATAVVPLEEDCPLQVRAIVFGDQPDTTFVVLGWQDQSILLGVGEGTRTAIGWVAVSEIKPEAVALRVGEATFRCELE